LSDLHVVEVISPRRGGTNEFCPHLQRESFKLSVTVTKLLTMVANGVHLDHGLAVARLCRNGGRAEYRLPTVGRGRLGPTTALLWCRGGS